MEDCLSDEGFIDNFSETFLGYGDYDAPLWFVGMEEGGGASKDEVVRKLNAWKDRGSLSLEDLSDFHDAVIVDEGFDKIKKQPTWAKLSRIVLRARDEAATSHKVTQFWRRSLGRHGSKTCLLELMPLPAPSTRAWPYKDSEWSRLPFLQSRKAYHRRYRDMRIKILREKIRLWQPRALVFYGKAYFPFWAEIAGREFEEVDGYSTCLNDGTQFFRIDHPTAPILGRTVQYFDDLGARIKEVK